MFLAALQDISGEDFNFIPLGLEHILNMYEFNVWVDEMFFQIKAKYDFMKLMFTCHNADALFPGLSQR